MRYFCMAMLLASAIGLADGLVTAEQQRPAVGQPGADAPKEFGFLFQSPDQRIREITQRGVMTYLEELWKGLPYDSISLERGGTGGCLIACASSYVTLHRATVSGMGVVVPAPCRTAPCTVPGDLRGRAELRTVAAPSLALAGLTNVQPPEPAPGELERVLPQKPVPVISDFEGSVDIYTFANLSYLLHRARFLDLPNEYACNRCPGDRSYVMLSVAAGGKTKTVIDYGETRPVELWAIQQAFDSVSKNIRWTQK